jgi:PAS domain S-box-containing protein
LLRHIIESLDDGVVAADLDQRVLLRNPAAERLLGPGLSDVSTSEWTSVFGCFLPDMITPCPPEDLPMAHALLGEVVTDFELLVRSQHVPDGRWLSMSGTPLRDNHGAIEGGVVVFHDVTARKRRLEEIQFLSNAVEETADCVLITDQNGRIEYVNPAFETITGYSRAETVGKTPSMLKSGVHAPDFYRDLWATLLEGRVFHGTITNRRKSGELFLSEQTITPVSKPRYGISRFVSVARDVTKVRKATEQASALLLARSVQQRLYPTAAPKVPGFDICGAAFVADVVGGDYFDFVTLPNERYGLVMGDVSGHAFDSALLMAETRALLRSTAQTTFEPADILSIMNRVLVTDTEDNRFVTLLVVSLHPPTRTFRYASAGHMPGYVLDGSGVLKMALPATGLPLGLFPDAAFSTSSERLLAPGEMLLLMTDGVTESEAPEDTTVGVDRMLEVVRSSRGERSSEIVGRMHRAARTLAGAAPQKDDMAFVLCRAETTP